MHKKFILNNGIQVVLERTTYVQSISIGIFIKAGSRDENSKNNGVSHLIEHMLFKGTKGRTARQIAEEIDSIGGQLNAYTSKELTCYYAKVLTSHSKIAIDILSDMILCSNFDPKELDKEKGVVLEEISMYEDAPEDLVHDLFSQIVLPNHPLGFDILGTKESILNLNREVIMEYYEDKYIPSNAVISIVGNYNEVELLEQLEEYFGKWKSKKRVLNKKLIPEFTNDFLVKKKDTEQVHVCLGLEGISHDHKSIYALLVFDNIFGGGMSSRLFQGIREDKGLAYSIFSYPTIYSDIGIYNIYVGMNIAQLDNVIVHILEELNTMITKGVSDKELYHSKEQLKGSYMLGLESTSSRMSSMGKSQLLYNKILTPKEILTKIDAVEMSDISTVVQEIFENKKLSFTAIGNVTENEILKFIK